MNDKPKTNVYATCEQCEFKTGKSFSNVDVITAIALHSVLKHDGQINSTLFNPEPVAYVTKAVC